MRLLSSVAFIASFTLLHAQGREKILNTDSGRVVLHYFTTGQLSTKEWMDTDDRWGRSWAFTKDGRELINYQTRKIGGHASVDFSYHSNGSISKAEVSDAPDGGIQWYRSTTTFDENGNRTGFTEQGHDNEGPIPGPGVRLVQAPLVTRPIEHVVEEQHMFVNEVFAVNATKWPCVLKVDAKQASPALPSGSFTLQPGDSVRVGAYSVGESFDDPDKHVTFTAQRQSSKGRERSTLDVSLLQQKQMGKEHMSYYFQVRPVAKPWYGMKWLMM